MLVASLGGTTWAWGSARMLLVGAAAVVLLVVFAAAERRAREPVLPLAVLRDQVFRIAGVLSLIVGFALFGSVTFLPLFFQTVVSLEPDRGRPAPDAADRRPAGHVDRLRADDLAHAAATGSSRSRARR